MVVTFSGNVTVTGSPQAQVTSGTGCVGSAGTCTGNVTVSGNTVTIPLTNIANAQTINVRINGVNSAADAPATDFTIPMSILIGDTNSNATVNAADVAQWPVPSLASGDNDEVSWITRDFGGLDFVAPRTCRCCADGFPYVCRQRGPVYGWMGFP